MMIPIFMWQKINDVDIYSRQYEVNASTCHMARHSMDLVKDEFENSNISCRGQVI